MESEFDQRYKKAVIQIAKEMQELNRNLVTLINVLESKPDR
jgi:hypothetical protein